MTCFSFSAAKLGIMHEALGNDFDAVFKKKLMQHLCHFVVRGPERIKNKALGVASLDSKVGRTAASKASLLQHVSKHRHVFITRAELVTASRYF